MSSLDLIRCYKYLCHFIITFIVTGHASSLNRCAVKVVVDSWDFEVELLVFRLTNQLRFRVRSAENSNPIYIALLNL